ncbi:MAG: STELLO glycosyltransferase family protein [Planctomycetota bacterium]
MITTIQEPTSCVIRLANAMAPVNSRMVVAGDSKGPAAFDLTDATEFDPDRLTFLSLADQLESGFALAPLLPTKHYCRKNLGYLDAIRGGATSIYETDDDNAPLDHWAPRQEWIDAPRFVERSGNVEPSWINAYKFFTDQLIWPRGLPLDRIREPSKLGGTPPQQLEQTKSPAGQFWAPVQQGLADGAPDVDAVWRLTLDSDFTFRSEASVMLGPGQWCPFNTQTTWWWPVAYPLLYVPSYCSFRMCDIWKSFVAQRCLWELGSGIVFHASEVVQERNPHNLMRDFEDEIPGYLKNHDLVKSLESVDLSRDRLKVGDNLRTCYEQLVTDGFFPKKELPLVNAWLQDIQSFGMQPSDQDNNSVSSRA